VAGMLIILSPTSANLALTAKLGAVERAAPREEQGGDRKPLPPPTYGRIWMLPASRSKTDMARTSGVSAQ
jgi:hypothetical protein